MFSTYYALPRPHPNSRYQAGALKLMRSEILALLDKAGAQANVVVEQWAGPDWIKIECAALTEAQIAFIRRAAHLYVLFARREGALMPLCGPREPYLGDDLPAALKYKGKTNEVFTAYMLNLALCASDFQPDDKLCVADPMCGRGTTLFCALNAGFDALGVDVDRAAIDEGLKYFERYLEYHHLKHNVSRQSLTAGPKEACAMADVTFAADPARYKAGETRRMRVGAWAGERLNVIFKKPQCHLIVCDLPYGVQHAPGAKKGRIPTIEDTLYANLPAWVDCLHTGGAVAISYNVNTLKSEMARGMLAEMGLDVAAGEAYEGLAHWVEQAITRDVAVGVKRY